MSVKEINIDNVIDVLKNIVEGKESYVDPRGVVTLPCRYASDDDYPGCLIGQVYKSLGAYNDELAVMDKYGIITDVLNKGLCPIPTTVEAADVMQRAQEQQDLGNTWGVALAIAAAEAESLRVQGGTNV
jgi:hypothetical protein